MLKKEKEAIYKAIATLNYGLCPNRHNFWHDFALSELKDALFPPPKPPQKKGRRKKTKK